MSKGHTFIFNNTIVAVEEKYKGDLGCVLFGKKLEDGNINVFLETYSPSIVEFFIELQKYIANLETNLAESEKRLKDIDDWKGNYGYSNYEDVYMLEDLQSRAFQSEDDTTVVNEILDYFNIFDENEILPTIKQRIEESNAYKLRIELAGADETITQLKQQLAEKEKDIHDRIKQVRTLYVQLYELQKAVEYCHDYHKKNKLTPVTLYNYTNEKHNQDKISFAVKKLEKVKEFCDGIKLSMIYISQEDTTKIQTIIEEIDNQIEELKKEMK